MELLLPPAVLASRPQRLGRGRGPGARGRVQRPRASEPPLRGRRLRPRLHSQRAASRVEEVLQDRGWSGVGGRTGPLREPLPVADLLPPRPQRSREDDDNQHAQWHAPRRRGRCHHVWPVRAEGHAEHQEDLGRLPTARHNLGASDGPRALGILRGREARRPERGRSASSGGHCGCRASGEGSFARVHPQRRAEAAVECGDLAHWGIEGRVSGRAVERRRPLLPSRALGMFKGKEDRQNCHHDDPLYGRGGGAGRPDRHHGGGADQVRWVFLVPQVAVWRRLHADDQQEARGDDVRGSSRRGLAIAYRLLMPVVAASERRGCGARVPHDVVGEPGLPCVVRALRVLRGELGR
mmetsp:Transcript_29205/g.83853  ORF Transcript_29205/g.83853 Transcript_29205/m.83853 type:complete len:352 (+) Transcript_29205:1893-2948(+)